MQSSVRFARLLLALAIALNCLAPRSASASDPAFTYINANPDNGANAIAAFLTSDGHSSPLPGSPFATGGNGLAPVPGAEFAHRIVVAHPRNLLFAANDGSGTISVFNVDPVTGLLSAVLGSPFIVGDGTPFSGISLAVSSDGRFLYASSGTVVSFFVDANGGLNEVGSRWSFSERVAGSSVSSDNSHLFLSTASGVTILHTGEGGLTAVPPDLLSIGSTATDLRTNAKGTRIWVGTKTGGIGAYTYDSGSASLVVGAPFFLNLSDLSGLAGDSDGNLLFAYSPGAAPRLLGARINPDGSLVLGNNSPLTPVLAPTGAAVSPDGTLLMLTDGLGHLDAWGTLSDGTIAHQVGYPVATGASHGFPSVVTFPKTTPVPAVPLGLIGVLAAFLCLGSLASLRRAARA